MRKTDVKKLRKGQIVYYGGFAWKFYSAQGYVNGISNDSLKKMDNKEYDGYILILKAIDGTEYSHYGQYAPRLVNLTNQYWCGVYADYKKVQIGL